MGIHNAGGKGARSDSRTDGRADVVATNSDEYDKDKSECNHRAKKCFCYEMSVSGKLHFGPFHELNEKNFQYFQPE